MSVTIAVEEQATMNDLFGVVAEALAELDAHAALAEWAEEVGELVGGGRAPFP